MKKKKLKKIICILAAVLTVCALPSGVFADYGFGYLDEAIYFERDSAGGWTDYVQNEYHLNDEDGALIYCVEGGNPFCWDELTQYVGWDETIDALYDVGAGWRLKDGISVERYLKGLVAIASWGYPYYIPDHMYLPEVRYATSAAMHVYTALCVEDPASSGFGKSYWGEYEPEDRMRPKASEQPRADVVYDWFETLYEKGLYLDEMPHSVSFSAPETELAVSGEYFTGQVSVRLENMLGGYVIDQFCLDEIAAAGGSVSGFTGRDGDVLTISIPKKGNRDRSFSLSVTAKDPRNTADFGIVMSTYNPGYYQKCVGFMGVAGDLVKTASAVIKTGNYGLPVNIVKSSSADWTAENGMYSLAGARFRLSGTDAAGASLSEELTLDDQGRAEGSAEFAVGTQVTAEEISAPAGFKAADAVSIVISEDADNVIRVTDDPVLSGSVQILTKKDSQMDTAQGGASLEGAEYSVSFYGGLFESAQEAGSSGTLLKSWVFRTDASGLISLDEAHKVSGDTLYLSGSEPVLPLGTMVIREQIAPEGYKLDGQTYLVRISEGSTEGPAVREGEGLDTSGRVVSAETVKCFGIRGVKFDADKDASEASGDAALSGGRISVINRSENAVNVAGKTIAPGETAAEILTAASGGFVLSAQLPYGSYELVESKAPAGYSLSSWSYTFTASPSDEDGTIFEVPAGSALKDEVLLQDLVIRKWDRQRGIGITGAAVPKEALEGISFEVINRSSRSVVWDGRTIEPGETVSTAVTAIDEESGEYRAVLSGLPYGTYGIRELAAAGGNMANGWYLADSTAEVQIELHKTGTDRVTFHDVADTRICSLTVSKTVSGNMGSKDRDFGFELALGENGGLPVSFEKTLADGSRQTGTAVFSGGRHSFSRRHGESITFGNIVCGSSYKLTEPGAEEDGYTLSWTGEHEGVLTEDTAVMADNNRSAVVSTGLVPSDGGGAASALGCFAAAAVIFAAGRKERDGKKSRKDGSGGRA